MVHMIFLFFPMFSATVLHNPSSNLKFPFPMNTVVLKLLLQSLNHYNAFLYLPIFIFSFHQ